MSGGKDENPGQKVCRQGGADDDAPCTRSRSRVQAKVSRSMNGLNEGIELDMQSIYSRMSKNVRYRRQDDGLVGPIYLTFSNIR